MIEEKAVDRMMAFAKWCKETGLVKSRYEFEALCGLSRNYLNDTRIHSRGNIGVEIVEKVYNRFPMLNISWIVTGRGDMIASLKSEEKVAATNARLIDRINRAIDILANGCDTEKAGQEQQ